MNSTKITTAIYDVKMLSMKLCEKCVIAEDAHQALTEKSRKDAFHDLLNCAVNAVRVDAKKFDKVLDSLKECGAGKVAEDIRKSSEDIRKSSEPNGKL